MDHILPDNVLDPAKCDALTFTEKREFVYQISRCADNAPEILLSWSRKELIQLLCAELGMERKYSGKTKTKVIDQLLKLVSQRNGNSQTRNLSRCRQDESMSNDRLICRNAACRSRLREQDEYCRRCSCSICHKYDEKRVPSLWLECSSDDPYNRISCGASYHLKCALSHEKAGILKKDSDGCGIKLDGCFFCICCGKVNWLMGVLQKQLSFARVTAKADDLLELLSLSQEILRGTERYVNLYGIIDSAVMLLTKEVGSHNELQKSGAASRLVNELRFGADIQKLCCTALEVANSLVRSASGLNYGVREEQRGIQPFCPVFEEITPFSVVVSLLCVDDDLQEKTVGFKLWHRSASTGSYLEEPTCIVLKPDSKVGLSNLNPATEYLFKIAPFSDSKMLGCWEARCSTAIIRSSSDCVSVLGAGPQGNETDGGGHMRSSPEDSRFVNSNSVPSHAKDTPDSAHKQMSAEQRFDRCVKVIRELERDGHMEKEFRVKFLTWFSVKATVQEIRIVSAFIDALVDEPASLVAQLEDTFTDLISSREAVSAAKRKCTRLWH